MAQVQQKEPEIIEQPETTEVPEQETTVEVVETPQEAAPENDAAADLKKQIEGLRRAEELQRQGRERAENERQEALRRAREYQQQITVKSAEVTQSRFDAVTNGIAAATAEAETAQRDLEAAILGADAKAQADAQRRIARAESNLSRLEEGKAALEAEYRASQAQPQPQQQPVDPIDAWNLPDTAKTWLKGHRDYVTDPRKNAKIQALHWDIVDEGHEAFSTTYFESMERHLGLREPVQQQPQKGPIVSAPVSRDVPGTVASKPSQIRLSAAQREAAKISGVSEVDYAKNLIKFEQEKAVGNYGERR